MAKEKVIEKIDSIFKEELWGRIEPKDTGISKFKILDDIFNSVVSDGIIPDTLEICRNHLNGHPESISAAYLTGLIGYHTGTIEDMVYLRKMMDVFTDSHKWAIVEIIAEKILEYGESSVALRFLATSLERLGRNREAIPVWDNLLKIDRFDANVSKKLAFAIIDTDPEKSIYYMKIAIEGFIKNQKYDEVTSLWNKLINVSVDDITFFERIERMLIDVKQEELTASLLKALLLKYRDEDNPEQAIEILKKILGYRPDDGQARRELIKLYESKYGDHSQFEQFMKLSKLANFKTPVKYAILDFEKNIVFDKGNYVFHISWKTGKIIDINSEHIIINFKDKPEHKMSIQMALQSLTPLSNDHLYVMEYEDPEILKELFRDDFMKFFEILIKSYNSSILLSDIKNELIPDYIESKDWAKWWSKARTKIKKDPLFGVSDKKKDLFFMRDKPVTFADELLGNFIQSESFSGKLDIAIEFINNIEKREGEAVSRYLIDYFTDEAKEKSTTRQLLSYFILKDLAKFSESSKIKLDSIESRVVDFIKSSQELQLVSMKISSYDYKKDFVNIISESRDDWPEILAELLFETPVRIHKYIINRLIRAHAYNIINSFIDKVITGAKQYPEIFLWVSKNLLMKTWDYDWLDYSREALNIAYFRLMNELKKIEIEGNRLKNMSVDLLFDNDYAVLKNIVSSYNPPILAKIYDLFSNVAFIEDSKSETLLTLIKEKFPDFKPAQEIADEVWTENIEKLIVTQEGFDRKKAELEKLVNDDMVSISRELSKVSEASADPKENVEYNALMEKQSILKLSISKLDDEIKRADILDANSISTEKVGIGASVVLKETDSGEKLGYIILGPWDADFEKFILSYRSPIARSIMGKKVGEKVDLKIDDAVKTYSVESIKRYDAV